MLRKLMLFIAVVFIISCKKNPGGETVDNPLQVAEAKDLGILKTPAALVGRDGGQSALISGKIVWLFGDSFFDRKGVDGLQYRTNTSSQSTVDQPLMTSEPTDANGVSPQFIPFTNEEKRFNDSTNSPNDRIGLWPTGIVSGDGVNAMIFYTKVYLKDPWQDFGIGIAKYKIGQTQAVRNEELLFNYPEPNFETAFLHEGYLYLYGRLRDKTGVGVARALFSEAEDRAAYEFWDGKSWNKEVSKAAGIMKDPGGSFSYNRFYNLFMHVYGKFGNNHVYVRFATAPQGPWSNEKLLYETMQPEKDHNYLMIEHPELAKNNGQTIVVSYHRPTKPFLGGEIRLVEITLEK